MDFFGRFIPGEGERPATRSCTNEVLIPWNVIA